MDLLDTPTPLTDAVKHLLSKAALPTSLNSSELKQLDSGLRRQSLFSARTLDEYHLDNIRAVVESILNPKTETRVSIPSPGGESDATLARPSGEGPGVRVPGEGGPQTRQVTVGLNPATARAALRKGLKDHGYLPSPDDQGTLKDLSSDARLNLVIRTNVQLAQGAGQFVSGNADQDTVDLFPAWELVRFEDREIPRGEKLEKGAIVPDPAEGWPARFKAAAEDSGDEDALRVLQETGRMIALKASPLWDSLGSGAGGFDDTLDNPYPPFAFNSGMNWLELSRADCIKVGLIGETDKVEPALFDFASLFNLKEAA